MYTARLRCNQLAKASAAKEEQGFSQSLLV
jgi:hypothetical protein